MTKDKIGTFDEFVIFGSPNEIMTICLPVSTILIGNLNAELVS